MKRLARSSMQSELEEKKNNNECENFHATLRFHVCSLTPRWLAASARRAAQHEAPRLSLAVIAADYTTRRYITRNAAKNKKAQRDFSVPSNFEEKTIFERKKVLFKKKRGYETSRLRREICFYKIIHHVSSYIVIYNNLHYIRLLYNHVRLCIIVYDYICIT